MKYLKIFTDFLEDIEPLSTEERGRLFTSMLLYARSGEVTELPGNERFVWPLAKRYIDTQAEAYRRLCERNRKNGKRLVPVGASGGQSLQDKDKDKDKDNLSKERGADQYTNEALSRLEVVL